jgi:hypothetical protein
VGIVALLGCGCSGTSTSSAIRTSLPAVHTSSPAASKVPPGTTSFPGHTCLAYDALEHEAVAVTPSAPKYDDAARTVCQQLFGAPKTRASAIPAGYVQRCAGFGYGLIARVYTAPGAKNDCRELAQIGYKVTQ